MGSKLDGEQLGWLQSGVGSELGNESFATLFLHFVDKEESYFRHNIEVLCLIIRPLKLPVLKHHHIQRVVKVILY